MIMKPPILEEHIYHLRRILQAVQDCVSEWAA